MYTVYILKSRKTGRLYIGTTRNLHARLQRHNAGRNKSTRAGRPWIVVYTEIYQGQSVAVRREFQLKRQKGGNGIKKILERWPSG